ncbi:MAG: 50S ribosomal protein L11 methyltransferase [Gammaproteobacteria bacterium]
MAWHQISVITDKDKAPQLADFFSKAGAVSVTYMDAEDEPVYEPGVGETVIWSNTEVVALFELDAEPELIASLAQTQFPPECLRHWRHERLEDQAWERAWMDYYQPMKFADRLWVCPSGQERSEPGTLCLTLDPGLAFGTGTHPTTALCLEWLASHDLAGQTVIDYGCGSGILAVAAVLLGAKWVHAVDIDPQALTATRDNAVKNGIRNDAIVCCLPERLPEMRADIVLANILAKPLCDLNVRICSLLNDKGRLILSGILKEQTESVVDAYRNKILFDEPVQREDWIRLSGIAI